MKANLSWQQTQEWQQTSLEKQPSCSSYRVQQWTQWIWGSSQGGDEYFWFSSTISRTKSVVKLFFAEGNRREIKIFYIQNFVTIVAKANSLHLCENKTQAPACSPTRYKRNPMPKSPLTVSKVPIGVEAYYASPAPAIIVVSSDWLAKRTCWGIVDHTLLRMSSLPGSFHCKFCNLNWQQNKNDSESFHNSKTFRYDFMVGKLWRDSALGRLVMENVW